MGHSENRLTGEGAAAPARIGPNSIIRVAEALAELEDHETCAQVFERAGLAHYLEHPPAAMVDEREVAALHRALRELIGVERARRIGRDAGRRTGEYLLAVRIPAFAQRILKLLPAPLAERMLLKAIARNAWTFAGSARFEAHPGRPTRLVFVGSPVCRDAKASEPLCDFYAGTFERLFRELVHRRAEVVEVQCQGKGDAQCVFEARRSR